MRVAIYARTSRQEGADEGSIPVQLADCRALAEDEGWDVVVEYQDPGITGWRRKTRPGYEQLFADAQAGRIDAVLCRDYERLLRNDIEGQRWLDLYDVRRFRLFMFADEQNIDLNRARDRKDWKERVAAAVYYSDRLSEKVRRTKQAQLAAGTYTGGEAEPFGYKRVDGSLVVDPDEAAHIHEAVRRLRKGDSLYRIVADWNSAGVLTSRGARWRPKSLRRLLTSAHLTGERGYPRILLDAEATIARGALDEEPVPGRGRPSGRRHPLSGLVRCGDCGARMTAARNMYRCGLSAGGCGKMSIRAYGVEYQVLSEVVALPAKQQPAVPDTSTDIASLLAELHAVEAQIEETQALVGGMQLRARDAVPILSQLRDQQELLTEQVARDMPAPTRNPSMEVVFPDSRWDWGVFTPNDPTYMDRWVARELTEPEVLELRALIESQVDHVTVTRREVPGKSHDPTRVAIAFR